MKIISAIASFILFFSGANPVFGQEMSEDFSQLAEWMTGEYTNSAQAKDDPSYRDLSLKIMRIWPESPTGVWLYVEESKVDSIDTPFLQKVFFLSEISDGEYSVDLYTIPEASKYIGAWKNPSLFDGKTAFDLKHDGGCAWFLNYDGFQYSGKTNTGSCKTPSESSEYSTTNIILLSTQFQFWNRGYTVDEKQVTGPTEGAYIFKKL